jgi:hypothetical protein
MDDPVIFLSLFLYFFANVRLIHLCTAHLSRLLLRYPMGWRQNQDLVSRIDHSGLPILLWSLLLRSIFSVEDDRRRRPNMEPESVDGKFLLHVIPETLASKNESQDRWFYDVQVGDPRTPPPPQKAEVKIPKYTPKAAGSVRLRFYPDHCTKVVTRTSSIRHPTCPMSAEDKKHWDTRESCPDD